MILRRLAIALAALVLIPIVVIFCARYWLLHTESGARFAWGQAEGALGGAMTAASVSGSVSDGLLIEGFHFGNDTVIVDIERFEGRLEVSVRPLGLRVLQPQVAGVRVEILPSADDEPARPAGEIVESLRLPLDLDVQGLTIADGVVVGAAAEDIVIDRASASVLWLDSIDVTDLMVDSPLGHARVSGDLSLDTPYDFDTTATIEIPVDRVGATAASIAMTGAVGRSVNGNAAIRAEDDSVDALIAFEWSSGGRLSGAVEVVHLELHRFVEQWPAAGVLSGVADVTLSDAGFDIGNLELSASNTGLTVTANGGVDLQSARVSGDLVWQGFQWPLIGDAPVMRSDRGDVVLRGSLDAWEVDGTVHVATIGVDDGEFVVRGGGDRTQASGEILESRILGGTASGRVAYSWVGPQAWSAVVDVDGIQTGLLEDQLAGTVSGHLDATGQVTPFELDATLESIEGNLLGRSLSANGRVLIADSIVAADNLAILHGKARFLLNGSMQDVSGLQFDIDIDDLGAYVDDAEGALSATGTVSIDDRQPFLDIDASSPRLAWRDMETEGLRVENVDSSNAIDVIITADVATVSGRRLQDTRAAVTLNREHQSLELTTVFDNATFDLAIAGAFDDWQAPDDWRGEINAFGAAVPDLPAIRLLDATPVQLSRQRALLESACIGTEENASLCMRAEWAAGDFVDLQSQLDGLPVDIVNLFRDTGFRFEQTLNGEIRWRQERDEPATGFANIGVTAGQITNDARPDIIVQTAPGRLAFDVADGKFLSGMLQLPMPGTGQIEGNFAVADVEQGLDSTVEGRLEIDMNNMALLAAISPLVDEASGNLQVNVVFSGTAQAPVMTGDMNLVGGALGYVPLGLRVREINLEGMLKPDRKIEISGSFRAGEGRGEVFTGANYEHGMTTGVQIEIRGQGLQVIDLPDISAIADVDLDLGYNGDQLNIAGSVKIPQARILPANLGEGRVMESDDVVIVAGQLPDDDRADRDSTLKVYGDLAFELGDNVVIELAVARATATGTADFSWNGETMPMANGRYTIAGDIQAFGQVLTISEGIVRYPNVPANDPQIRLFAEREIYGNPQIKTAGVLVAGSLRRPTIEAYTTPLTTEERALTLLVTGSDFDYEQGVGAIDFGTYIAPRLFVSYGVGIFDRDNVISARYDLTEGFGIKASSGQKESGVDITYRIER